jgi:hypothetical protein
VSETRITMLDPKNAEFLVETSARVEQPTELVNDPTWGAHTAPEQWEYAMFLQRPSAHDPMAGWTHAGRHGWELVAVVPQTPGLVDVGDLGYFKRRLR